MDRAFAAACFLNGDRAGAVAAQQRALAQSDPKSQSYAEMAKDLTRYQDPAIDLSPAGRAAQEAITAAQPLYRHIWVELVGDENKAPLARQCAASSPNGFVSVAYAIHSGKNAEESVRDCVKNKSLSSASPIWIEEPPPANAPAGTSTNYVLIDALGDAAKTPQADKRIMELLATSLSKVYGRPLSVAPRPAEAGNNAAGATYMIVDADHKEVPLTVELMTKG